MMPSSMNQQQHRCVIDRFAIKFDVWLHRVSLLNIPPHIWRVFTVLVYLHFALSSITFTFGVICFCLGAEYSFMYIEVNCSDGANVWIPLVNLIVAFTGIFSIKTLQMHWPAVIHCVGLIMSFVYSLVIVFDSSFAAHRWFHYSQSAPPDEWAKTNAWMDVTLVLLSIFNEVICLTMFTILIKYWYNTT